MPHDHETIVIDSDKHFVIDPVTRTITTESPKLKLMQYDHKSERYTFEIPKTIEGHDMTLCNKIRIHYLNTGSSDRHADVHEVEDMQVSGDDPNKLLFSWLIERTATQFAGTLSFAVRFYCILDDSTVDYSWGTDIFNNITVSNGMENTEQVIEDYSDLIASIQKEIADLKLNGVGGTKDYLALTNKPSIGGVELVGDKTLDDIGAQPKGTYLTKESDPTVPSWAKNPTKPTYTATEVGADPTGTAQNKVSAHNTAGDAHNDIRLLVQGLTDRLNALADSDDNTLDQMSEIVAYIKSNKSLIDGITTGKVNVADIVNNLTTNASNKPLSAAQGVALKALIDGIIIPETLPNPQKLKFTGAVTAEYDGSTEQTVNIPESTGGDSYTLPIMSNTQLGGGKAVEKTDEDVPVAVDPGTGQLFVPTYPESASSEITVKTMQNTDTTVTLPEETPYDLYIFPEMAELAVTITDANTDVHFFFDSGTTATVFSLQSQDGGQIYTDAYSIDANMRYEVSVLHNVAYIKGVAISEA